MQELAIEHCSIDEPSFCSIIFYCGSILVGWPHTHKCQATPQIEGLLVKWRGIICWVSFGQCMGSPRLAFGSSSKTLCVFLMVSCTDVLKLNTSIKKFRIITYKFRPQTTLKTDKVSLEHTSTSKVQLSNVLIIF